MCLRDSSYDGGEGALAAAGAAGVPGPDSDPAGKKRPMHGAGCSGNEELGDRTGDGLDSPLLNGLKTL